MGTISRQYTFIAGAIPSAANWNADPNNFITLVNGQIDEANVDYSSADGIATLQNTQTITGTKTFSSSGGAVFNYGIVINEGSNDSDTRIETNNMANAVVVDAGLDVISFGAAAVDDSFVQIAKGATTSAATQNTYHLSVAPGGATTIPAGTTAYVGSVNINEPNITATGTVTNAFTVRIAGAPTEGGTSNYALWVDAGATQLDGTLTVGGILSVDDTTNSTSTTTGSIHTDGGIGWVGDAYVGDDMFFTSAAVLNFAAGDVTVTHASNLLTVGGGDLHVANGQGLVVGHTAALTVQPSVTPSVQVIGTDGLTDSGFAVTNFQATALGARIMLAHSNHGTIGTHAVLDDGDQVGTLGFSSSDGTVFQETAHIRVFADAAQGSGDLPTRMVFSTTADGAATTTERMRIDSAGAVTKPTSPAFSAASAAVANVTGDDTVYTMIYANERFDRGGNFATSTFTAPVTGVYQLTVLLNISGIASGHDRLDLEIVTHNASYSLSITDAIAADGQGLGFIRFSDTVLADMDMTDTATVRVAVHNGAKVVDIDTGNMFMGFLVG